MRVITGSARGRRLETPAGNAVRPTTEKVKESIFNIIQFQVPGSRVIDLFAGSGQLGIEALSRGAESALFLDTSPVSLNCVRRNLEHTGLGGKAEVRTVNSVSYLRTSRETFDVAFLDPPYGDNVLPDALGVLAPRMSDEGVIVCESAANQDLPETVGTFGLYREYRYGKIKLTVYRKQAGPEEEASAE